jgi:hypothetical protein
MKMPSTTCQNFTAATAKDRSMDCLSHRAMPGSIRTEILFDDDEVLKIYHIGRQATSGARWERSLPRALLVCT